MIRAAAYIRVSTERQAEEDRVSLDEQHKDIAAYCQGKGYTVVKEYQDVGSGASKRRPQFQQLLWDAQDGEFDVIHRGHGRDRGGGQGLHRLEYLRPHGGCGRENHWNP